MEQIHSIEKPTTRRGTNKESNIDGTCFEEMKAGPVRAKVVEKKKKKKIEHSHGRARFLF